ncbi:TetR/AcrR family transcriptional regulator [Paenibacillus sp. JX-17]|uniref:TetR/AcrR family transcriptional regulator n=1 Tax=Paenibacillus lacisoli TaxID=3064525 RepID=A0ABT9CGG2_9BACL|nr:TetR/AcrR family transcriptional regulator [Paenibacillus sp. JX-17]MDO7908296.1 TetR/AcrR family transcriptional regulator [Paenibacillus sp. JX-17]
MPEKPNSRGQIVETAAKLFFTQGYHGTGLNQIIKESHSPKGSLYYYFPDGKEELAVECIHCASQSVIEKIRTCVSESANTVEGLQLFIEGMVEESRSSQYRGFMPFSFWMAAETSCISDTMRKACQSAFTEWQDVIAEHLREEQMSAERADETASIFIAMLEGALILTLTNRDPKPLETAIKYVPYLVKNCPSLS